MTYAKPRIPIPFRATLLSHNINDRNTKNQALNSFTFPEVAYKNNFIPENSIKFAHHCKGENFKTEILSIGKDETVQKESILPDHQIKSHNALV